MNYKSISIEATKKLMQDFEKDQVIIIAWDKATGSINIATYGSTKHYKQQAAEGSKHLSKSLQEAGIIPNVPPTIHEDPNNRL